MRWVVRKCFYAGVAGESFSNPDGTSRDEVIAECDEGEQVRLIREPDNPRDRHAIKVCRQNGEQIGYLSRTCARMTAEDMDAGIPVGSVIGKIHGGGEHAPGVVLWMATYERRYEPDERVSLVRAPTRVGDLIARIVGLGNGREVIETWRDGAWHPDGPPRLAFKHKRYLKPEELAALGIGEFEQPQATSIEPIHPIGQGAEERSPGLEIRLDVGPILRDLAEGRLKVKDAGRTVATDTKSTRGCLAVFLAIGLTTYGTFVVFKAL